MLSTPLHLIFIVILGLHLVLASDLEKGNGHYGCPDCVRGKKPKPCSSSSCSSSAFDNPNVFFQQCCKTENIVDDIIWLQPDVGFYAFGFQTGNTGGQSCQNFYLNSPSCTLLWVLDCYCPGDEFQVTVDGFDETIQTVYQIRNPGPIINPLCTAYTSHPFNCFNQYETFARNRDPIIIPAGFHTITIDIMVSIFREGTGYLLLQTADPLYNKPACQNPASPLYPCNYSIFYPYNPFNTIN